MREIKFRGLDLMDGSWVYGGIFKTKSGKVFIVNELTKEAHRVDGESVGQFTGIHDKYGTGIYEGDILKSPASFDKVFWKEDSWGTEVMERHQEKGGWIVGYVGRGITINAKYAEVAGNIHDESNPLEDI
ncbi:conserved hypothetical protein [Bacillus sp. 349Y]|nr:conserved hypothetical protein [Bacillus sp. 349Y]